MTKSPPDTATIETVHWDAEGEAHRARLWPNETGFRVVAQQAAKKVGHDLILWEREVIWIGCARDGR